MNDVDLNKDPGEGEAPVEEYTDLTPMPFGMYKGRRLQDVPASYLHYLWTKKPLSDQRLEAYIKKNIPALKLEYKDGIWS